MRYQREDGCRAWLTCAMMNPCTLAELLRDSGSAETLYDEFNAGGGPLFAGYLTEKQLARLKLAAKQENMHRMMRCMQSGEIGIVAIDDPLYPSALTEISDPPALLFYRGSLRAAEGRLLTVIGTRNATPLCAAETEKIARELSEQGVTIVSGLAPGIDTAAHEGALQGGTPAVGVCACGIDVDYPAQSSGLKRRILEGGGLLISEFPLGTEPAKWVFEPRNRILAGLSRGVVMMEGMIRSGSMLTVSAALDQGREVFAYPGIPNAIQSEGSHQLLREGARYFTSSSDILEDMEWDAAPKPTQLQRDQLPDVSPEQKLILRALGNGDLSMDELTVATGLDAAPLSASLTILQMMGLVKALPGKRYARL